MTAADYAQNRIGENRVGLHYKPKRQFAGLSPVQIKHLRSETFLPSPRIREVGLRAGQGGKQCDPKAVAEQTAAALDGHGLSTAELSSIADALIDLTNR
jgi:hypothetical protein